MPRILGLVLALFLLSGCGDLDRGWYNPDETHSVEKKGARHMPGLEDPLSNCNSCHGTDLKGGYVQVSCLECHERMW